MTNAIHNFLFITVALACIPGVAAGSFFSKAQLPEKTSIHNIDHLNKQAKKLFKYDPAIELLNGTQGIEEITIACHGYGCGKEVGYQVAQYFDTPVLTFNFPHYADHHKSFVSIAFTTPFGTLNDYLPLIYALKSCIASGVTKINMYGLSAGGGAILNVLAILHNQKHARELKRIGVSKEDMKDILNAVSAGFIVLDVPLKSIAEIHAKHAHRWNMFNLVLRVLANRFKKNGLEPIEAIDQLQDLKLNVLVYFEQHDEVLSNRDDQLFYQKLKTVNTNGITQLVVGNHGGHNSWHAKLWSSLKLFKQNLIQSQNRRP